MKSRHWTAIYTIRDETIRIISVRRARRKEVELIDMIRQKIGVDRGALIKVWLHERVAKEKSGLLTDKG